MTVPLERGLSHEERAIAEWLLMHAKPPALTYICQLDELRVVGRCGCGCPTIHLLALDRVVAAEPSENPVAEAFGKVDGNLVGVMLLQKEGLLTCLEVYDLSETERPYGLPQISTLEPAVWNHT